MTTEIMSNPYFKFKKFTIHQNKCAMKVCTDACLFGAWLVKQFEQNQPIKILDIGTGTGLLTLMLAQKLTGTIDTIEIDESAYLQASDNILNSDWKNRINVINNDVKIFKFTNQYDLIISNPPFYENDLRSPEITFNMAKHDETLKLEVLLSIAALHLTEAGSFAVLIPHHRLAYCITVAANVDLFPANITNVKQSTHHNYFRSMIIFKKDPSQDKEPEEIGIKDGNDYTAIFIELLRDYYLYL